MADMQKERQLDSNEGIVDELVGELERTEADDQAHGTPSFPPSGVKGWGPK